MERPNSNYGVSRSFAFTIRGKTSNTFLIKWKTINDRFLKPVIVKKRRKVELLTHVKRQVFIRCTSGATACERSFPSISSASLLGYFTSCRPSSWGRRSGLLKVPNKPDKSLVLRHAVLTRSVDTAKRKKELDQYHTSQMHPNLYKWRYTFLMCSVIF